MTSSGKGREADSLRTRSLALATEAEVNALGYQYLGENLVQEALEMFRLNVMRYPNSWNAYDSLAEGLERAGDIEGAIINYRQALSLVTNASQKQRIRPDIDTPARPVSHNYQRRWSGWKRLNRPCEQSGVRCTRPRV